MGKMRKNAKNDPKKMTPKIPKSPKSTPKNDPKNPKISKIDPKNPQKSLKTDPPQNPHFWGHLIKSDCSHLACLLVQGSKSGGGLLFSGHFPT